MSITLLRRFSPTLLINKTSTDSAQVPNAFAIVNLYRQGATVSAATSIPTGGSPTAVSVYNLGSLVAGDTLIVGAAGAALAVSSVASTTSVLVTNSGSVAVALAVGDRLVPTTSATRPLAYADPYGTIAIGNSVVADADGQVAAYVNATPFDYIVTPGSSVAFDAASYSTLTGTGTLSWTHTAGTGGLAILVGISWQESTGTESLDSVSYGGAPMEHLGTSVVSGLNVDVYFLASAPAGAQTVLATWSGSNSKGAVGGAVSFSGVTRSGLGALKVLTGSGTSPSISFTGSNAHGMLFGVIGVDMSASLRTVTSSQTSRWNATGGTSGATTRTTGDGSSASGTGGTVLMAWTIGAIKTFAAAAIELTGNRLVIDAEGTSFLHSPFGVNAADYATLSAAVAAVPPSGGTVFVPAGAYILDAADLPIILNRPISIRGEGIHSTAVYVNSVPGNENKDLFQITNDRCRIEDMRIHGYINPGAVGTGVGIKIGSPPPSSGNLVDVQLRNLQIFDFASFGVQVVGGSAAGYSALDESVFESVSVGGCQQGAQFSLGRGTTTSRLVNCRAYANGVSANAPTGVVGYEIINCANITLDTCECAPPSATYAVHIKQSTFFGNDEDGGANITVRNCDFERAGRNSSAYLRAELVAGLVIEGNLFYDASGNAAVELAGCYAPLVQANVFKAVDNWCIFLDQCTNAVLLANTHEDPDGSGGARSPANYTDGGSTTPPIPASTGTVVINAGIVMPARFPSGSLPAYDAQRRPNGSLCFDATNGKLMVMTGGAWVVVGTQT